MYKIKYTIRTGLIYAAVVLLAGGYPMTAMAEAVDSATPPASTDTSVPTAPARTPEKYTFNPETQHWDSNKWAYNPVSGVYERIAQPPVSEAEPTSTADPITTDELQPVSTEPQSSSTINVDTNAAINNTLNSNATTGDANVKQNTAAGNATTGDATAVANIVNMMNSSVSTSGAGFASFVTDVVGDVHGDIMLYPMLLAAMLKAANTPSSSTVAVNNDLQINNDINLAATTGDANVKGNTTAGDATTGSANTVANVMNIINSIIAANQSFVGTVNIYGNLDGDILVAPDFLPQLLANNTGSSTTGGSLAVSSDDTQSIINNIDLSAISGQATVANNTNAGNASTGDAKTNLVLLNLSGHQVVAKDSLLVFVNVLGQWVGIIVDAPNGTSAAALGTGVTTNNTTPDLTIDVDSRSRIVNNIDLNSQSGDAAVTGNTTAGNATTGSATASANVANIAGSQFGLSGWFGVLFINVFGSWLGSFGVDTERGNTPAVTGGMGNVNPAVTSSTTHQAVQFIAHTANLASQTPYYGSSRNDDNRKTVALQTSDGESDDQGVMGAATKAARTPSAGIAINQSATTTQFDFLPFLAAAFLIGLGIIATKNVVAYLRSRRALA